MVIQLNYYMSHFKFINLLACKNHLRSLYCISSSIINGEFEVNTSLRIEPFNYSLPVYTIFDETDILVHAGMFKNLLFIAIEACI